MNKRKLLGLVASGALVLGAMLASTGVVSADGQVAWDGQQGLTDGALTSVECDENNTPAIHWVFTTGGGSVSAASITFGGSGFGTFAMSQNGGGSWSYDSDFFTLATLTASVSYTGTVGNANLVISHGCPGETETSSSSSSESSSVSETSSTTSVESSTTSVESSTTSVESSTTSVESSSTTSVESSSTSESHSQTVSGTSTSSSPTEPNTATIGDSGSSNNGSAAWLLVAALGALFGSILVLTPSRAKNRE